MKASIGKKAQMAVGGWEIDGAGLGFLPVTGNLDIHGGLDAQPLDEPVQERGGNMLDDGDGAAEFRRESLQDEIVSYGLLKCLKIVLRFRETRFRAENGFLRLIFLIFLRSAPPCPSKTRTGLCAFTFDHFSSNRLG